MLSELIEFVCDRSHKKVSPLYTMLVLVCWIYCLPRKNPWFSGQKTKWTTDFKLLLPFYKEEWMSVYCYLESQVITVNVL